MLLDAGSPSTDAIYEKAKENDYPEDVLSRLLFANAHEGDKDLVEV